MNCLVNPLVGTSFQSEPQACSGGRGPTHCCPEDLQTARWFVTENLSNKGKAFVQP